MLQIAIVEDDIRQQELLKEYLKRYFREDEKPAIMVYESGETFLAEQGRKPDILFLDIAMAGMSGMETARKIRETDRTMILIFVTELFQYALEGYAVNATDFLIKPVYYPSFCVSVKRAMDLLSERKPGMIRIPFDKTVTMVDISSIFFFLLDETRKEGYTYEVTCLTRYQ